MYALWKTKLSHNILIALCTYSAVQTSTVWFSYLNCVPYHYKLYLLHMTMVVNRSQSLNPSANEASSSLLSVFPCPSPTPVCYSLLYFWLLWTDAFMVPHVCMSVSGSLHLLSHLLWSHPDVAEGMILPFWSCIFATFSLSVHLL